jgi:hypothetical protein
MKKKNKLSKITSIIVKFYPATDKEINKLLKKLSLNGVCVSNLMNRWAIDVPYWKEKYYSEKLSESDLVEKVHPNPSYKKIYSNELVEEESSQSE